MMVNPPDPHDRRQDSKAPRARRFASFSRITEPVETKIGCEAIHSVGLYLGPIFQVARKLWRGNSSIGKNVSGLKIFGGVGKVAVARQESFSRFSGYWVHLRITESLESFQTFNVSVLADDGALLMSWRTWSSGL